MDWANGTGRPAVRGAARSPNGPAASGPATGRGRRLNCTPRAPPGERSAGERGSNAASVGLVLALGDVTGGATDLVLALGQVLDLLLETLERLALLVGLGRRGGGELLLRLVVGV